MSEAQIEGFKLGTRTQSEWGFGGRRKWRDGSLLLAFFFGGIGAGQYVISSWFIDFRFGALVGIIFVAVGKTVAHLIYLGRPSRFYRLFLRPQSSWISRGLTFMVIFVIFAGGYIAPEYGFPWLPWTSATLGGKIISLVSVVAAFLVMIYDGFLLASCKSIASWHTALIPVLYVTYSLAGGVALTSLTMLSIFGSALGVATLVTLDTFLLLTMFALVMIYIIDMAGSTATAKESLRRLTLTRVAISFIGVAIVAGLLMPLVLTFFEHLALHGAIATFLFAAAAILELAGDLSIRHSILRAGLHAPLL